MFRQQILENGIILKKQYYCWSEFKNCKKNEKLLQRLKKEISNQYPQNIAVAQPKR
jgi:hypothetical protein